MAASTYAPRLRNDAMAEMNVTPLVDVMLVMLVIFMIAAPAITKTLPMNLPIPSETPPEPPPRAELRVDSNGGFVLDGRVLNEAGLQAALDDIARRDPTTVLNVSAAAEAEYQGFATALAAAQGSGLGNIAMGD
ncbi:biopolymer transport protein exbD2 [Lysobacter xinjiangensis]|uniref:Biopolymer transport protein exbD2 n=1 Tax=Cognatilysobacter xinjiangensis TaxID=546892 RepID=A0ABQ3C248_9GAMM|nr:biopolymer transporter ExbD [Lysobacter xinjiangensis]GGZ64297.1 biopolymer transport protein exbD2 [Lysobacter xinjiangensis]